MEPAVGTVVAEAVSLLGPSTGSSISLPGPSVGCPRAVSLSGPSAGSPTVYTDTLTSGW